MGTDEEIMTEGGMRGLNRRAYGGFILAATVVLAAGCGSKERARCNPQCDAEGVCIDLSTGNRVNPDCTVFCPPGLTCDGDGQVIPEPIPPPTPPDPVPGEEGTLGPGGIRRGLCECVGDDAVDGDGDNDCIPDALETGLSDVDCGDPDHPGGSAPDNIDTDGDGINDGCEDLDQDGQYAPNDPQDPETNPSCTDSDGDGIPDGLEDTNQNGVVEPGESQGFRIDSDRDGIADGVEDRNLDGIFDVFEGCPFDVRDALANCFDDEDGSDCPETDPASDDSDGDGIRDVIEDANQNGVCDDDETCAFSADSDCDGVDDGREDSNRNGRFDTDETNPLLVDTDADGLRDGLEDTNGNGRFDATETDPRRVDSDLDGVQDGEEDRNLNGRVDADESDPRSADSDNDGIQDGLEDKNQDGLCDFTGFGPENLDSETCAFNADTDGDGINDGVEDANRNGLTDSGELDPRNPDSDFDGLNDGEEDLNGNGVFDQVDDETNPRSADTDRDGLLDGLELRCGTDPSSEDTDGDGIRDGEEGGVDSDGCPADALTPEPPPSEGSEERVRFNVCSAQNVSNLTFAESLNRDYRLAFELERDAEGVEGEPYFTTQVGFDGNGDGFDPLNSQDIEVGHVFQSPAGVNLDGEGEPINRDIYGFVVAQEDGRDLNEILDGVRDALVARGATQTGDLVARDAHDNLPNARVLQAERRFELELSDPSSAVIVRRELLRDRVFSATSLLGGGDPLPLSVPAEDFVYGPVNCAEGNERCFTRYTVSVAGVQRLDEPGDNGNPRAFLILALTPNTSDLSPEEASRYQDRVVRLEDLTRGTALARFAAQTGTACEREDQAQARADVLWVIDDSRSMQQIISRIQQAAAATQEIFSANTNNVDYRIAMTTTNPSPTARQICPPECGPAGLDSEGNLCDGAPNAIRPTTEGGVLGCINICPDNCTASCGDASAGAICDVDECFGSCTPADEIADAVADSAADFPLPGGAGTFYYEDSRYLDCNSLDGSGGLDRCDLPEFGGEFDAFYAAGSGTLTANQGFIGADVDDQCLGALATMDLSADTADANAAEATCERLTEVCGHGPTVLASQMCDLIRQMGGVPNIVDGSPDPTSQGRRFHSASEHGILQARRLLNGMSRVPDDGSATPLQLRDGVPVVTIFLSDEEDYFFKDECHAPEGLAANSPIFADFASPEVDLIPLPTQCRYEDGDPRSQEACSMEYCAGLGFSFDVPSGYDPTAAPRPREAFTDFTTQWRDLSSIAECSECAVDPCRLQTSQATCSGPQITTFSDGSPSTVNACAWDGSQCVSVCEEFPDDSTCEANDACLWDPVIDAANSNPDGESGVASCRLRYPLNDCAACKRFTRREQSVSGGGSGSTDLIGFNDLGPVYAVVRNAGAPGAPNDTCGGGGPTFGRGDGSAYRELAEETEGRTQDVCADDYTPFVREVVRDIVTLSAPYPLDQNAIASTIRVGVARPSGGSFDFFEVPRSSTSGFVFDAGTNSIGFISDVGDDPEDFPGAGDVVYISYRSWETVPCEVSCGSDEFCVTSICPDDPSEGASGASCTEDTDCRFNERCDGGSCVLECSDRGLVDRCEPQPCGPCQQLVAGSCQDLDDTCGCVTDPTTSSVCLDSSSCPGGFVCPEDSCACTAVSSCDDLLPDAGLEDGERFPDRGSCEAFADCCDAIALEDQVCGTLDATDCGTDLNCFLDNGVCRTRQELCCPSGDEIACRPDGDTSSFLTECIDQGCECAFAPPNGAQFCSNDADCFVGCEEFDGRSCPPGCEVQGGVCVDAGSSSGPEPQFQPQRCLSEDEVEALGLPAGRLCGCNETFYTCNENTQDGCGCVPVAF